MIELLVAVIVFAIVGGLFGGIALPTVNLRR